MVRRLFMVRCERSEPRTTKGLGNEVNPLVHPIALGWDKRRVDPMPREASIVHSAGVPAEPRKAGRGEHPGTDFQQRP